MVKLRARIRELEDAVGTKKEWFLVDEIKVAKKAMTEVAMKLTGDLAEIMDAESEDENDDETQVEALAPEPFLGMDEV